MPVVKLPISSAMTTRMKRAVDSGIPALTFEFEWEDLSLPSNEPVEVSEVDARKIQESFMYEKRVRVMFSTKAMRTILARKSLITGGSLYDPIIKLFAVVARKVAPIIAKKVIEKGSEKVASVIVNKSADKLAGRGLDPVEKKVVGAMEEQKTNPKVIDRIEAEVFAALKKDFLARSGKEKKEAIEDLQGGFFFIPFLIAGATIAAKAAAAGAVSAAAGYGTKKAIEAAGGGLGYMEGEGIINRVVTTAKNTMVNTAKDQKVLKVVGDTIKRNLKDEWEKSKKKNGAGLHQDIKVNGAMPVDAPAKEPADAGVMTELDAAKMRMYMKRAAMY